MKVKGLASVTDYSAHGWPETWYPFENMVADSSLNVNIFRNLSAINSSVVMAEDLLFSLTVIDERQLRYFAAFPDVDAEIDVTFTRIYGTFSGDEKCNIANIPFAYGSLPKATSVSKGKRFISITLAFPCVR
jgi:hypothetical protein